MPRAKRSGEKRPPRSGLSQPSEMRRSASAIQAEAISTMFRWHLIGPNPASWAHARDCRVPLHKKQHDGARTAFGHPARHVSQLDSRGGSKTWFASGNAKI